MADIQFIASANVPGRYLSRIVIAENAGTPALAKVLLKDGSTSGNLLEPITLAASGSVDITFTPPMYFPSGIIAVQVSTGTVRGNLTYQ